MDTEQWTIIFVTFLGEYTVLAKKIDFHLKDYFTLKRKVEADCQKRMIRITVQDPPLSFENIACLMKLELKSLANNIIKFNITNNREASDFMEETRKDLAELVSEYFNWADRSSNNDTSINQKDQQYSTLDNNILQAVRNCAMKGAFTHAKEMLLKAGIDLTDIKYDDENDTVKILQRTLVLSSLEQTDEILRVLGKKKDLFDTSDFTLTFVLYAKQMYECYRKKNDTTAAIAMLKLVETRLNEHMTSVENLEDRHIFNIKVWLAKEHKDYKNYDQARKQLLEALRYIDNPIDRADFWLTFAQVEYGLGKFLKSSIYLYFTQYSIFKTKDVVIICQYYGARSMCHYILKDLDALKSSGDSAKGYIEKLILLNDSSTTPEKVSLYERLSSLYSHYEHLHIMLIEDMTNSSNAHTTSALTELYGEQSRELAPASRERRIIHCKYYAFYWADMRISNGVYIEKMLLKRLVPDKCFTPEVNISYTPNSAYLLYSTIYLTSKNIIMCYIHTQHTRSVFKLNTRMNSKEKLLDHIAFLVEKINEGQTGENLIEEYQASTVARNKSTEYLAGETLFRILIEPILLHLKQLQIECLKIIAEEELQLVPFSGLIDEMGNYLVNLFTVAYPLLYTLDISTPKNKSFDVRLGLYTAVNMHPIIKKELGEEDEEEEDKDEVHHLAMEIRALQRIPGLKIASYTEHMAKEQLNSLFRQNDYMSLFHWCGHSIYDVNNVLNHKYGLSGAIVLEYKEGEDYHESLLYSADIAKLDLRHIPVVLLNSCESYKGKNNSKSGQMGITRALIVAGVACVISTLFTVNSEAGEFFSTHFYCNLLDGKTVLQSFTEAIRAMINSDSENINNSFYWSSYKLYGNGEVTLKFIDS